MNRTAIFALGAVALGLMGYILVFERDSLSTEEVDKRRGHLLETFVRERVSVLEIERDGRTLRLEREAAEEGGFMPWEVKAPWQDEADTDAIDGLLGELEWLDARRRIEDASAADLKSFGLDAPRFVVRFEAGRSQGVLEVGGRDVHDEGIYVRVNGGAVSVVPKTLDEVLDHPLSHFRTKQFLGGITVAWARHVEIHGQGHQVTLTRDGQRWWYEPEPRGFADRRRVETWLRAFDDLRATRYVAESDEDAARKAVEASAARLLVKIIPDEGREDVELRIVDVRIGGDCPGHDDERTVSVGKTEPLACVSDEDVATLLDNPGALRLWTPFGFDVSEIEGLRFETGEHSLTLSRDEDQWVTPQGGDDTVDRLTVEGWLADLAQARALSLAPRSEGPTLSSLDLDLAGGGSWRLSLGAPTLQGSAVRRADEPLQLVFDAGVADMLSYWPGRFRPLRLWEIQPSQLRALQWRDHTGRERSVELVDGTWREQGEDGAASDAARLREVVQSLAKMDAERIRAPHAEPHFGLATPHLSLRFTLDSGATHELRVGGRTESAEYHFAQLDDGVVVELSVESVATLREPVAPPLPAAPERPTEKPASSHDGEEHGHQEHGH